MREWQQIDTPTHLLSDSIDTPTVQGDHLLSDSIDVHSAVSATNSDLVNTLEVKVETENGVGNQMIASQISASSSLSGHIKLEEQVSARINLYYNPCIIS